MAVSLVVVAHSAPLARAAVALALEMAPDERRRPHIEVAAGLDETTLGTDAAAVAEALRRAHQASGGAGVLVLTDLGSAVLAAEMAVELVEPEVAAAVTLSAAPLVEGLVSAVVAAAAGADLTDCERDAALAQQAKAEHLGQPAHGLLSLVEPPVGGRAPHSVELEVLAEHGLHARPAARLVSTAARFAPHTRVTVRNLTSGRGPVDARSISAVAMLDARQGHRLLAQAHGPAAQEALAALADLAVLGFGDLDGPAQPLAEGPVTAPAISTEPGVAGSGLELAVGPVLRTRELPDPLAVPAGAPEAESARLTRALAGARSQLTALIERADRQLGAGEAEVFRAHEVILEDPAVEGAARARIEAGESAAAAWAQVVAETVAGIETLADAYQRERAQDVRSVGVRVLRHLLGIEDERVGGEGVLVVEELDPALALGLDASRVRGVITRAGGATGHGVLIATARGIPVLTGVGEVADVPEGTVVAFDARSGSLEVDPAPERMAHLEALLSRRRQERAEALREAARPAATTDGVRVRVRANIATLAEARLGADLGADGSGLVRTEAVFAHWRRAPSVAEQEEVFEALVSVFHPHPIAVRTWDPGGDKPLSFVRGAGARNPDLGLRGVRAFGQDPAALLDQLEAICRVAQRHRVRVLFPMVCTTDDVARALDLLAQAGARAGQRRRPDGLEVGIMVEVPAAALHVAELARGLDFVSIGTNDLAQYALAAERGNPALTPWSGQLEPAVLRLVAGVAAEVPAGVEVSLCGAMAADPDLAGLLVGLGVHELSTTPVAVPMVKQRVRAGSSQSFRELAAAALRAPDAATVRALVTEAGREGLGVSAPRAGGTGR